MRFAILSDGAVAQLGERQNRTLEVGSSTLLCSTNILQQFLFLTGVAVIRINRRGIGVMVSY
jgi:hypothetical protein